MMRTILVILGSVSIYAAWILVNDHSRTMRTPILAAQAATLLQQAWADHHTRS